MSLKRSRKISGTTHQSMVPEMWGGPVPPLLSTRKSAFFVHKKAGELMETNDLIVVWIGLMIFHAIALVVGLLWISLNPTQTFYDYRLHFRTKMDNSDKTFLEKTG